MPTCFQGPGRAPFRACSLIFILLSATAIAACDNPVEDNHDDEHSEVAGLELRINGVQAYRVLAGVVSCGTAPCGIQVSTGDDTPLITVRLLDEDGDEIDADHLDAAFSLGHSIQDTSVAEFEQHAEDGRWSFHIEGVAAGVTTMQLELLHSGHADFTTPPLSSSDAIVITVQ